MPDRFGRGSDDRSLYRWLEDWGFTDHPFAHSEAGREGLALLSQLFVDRPYFKGVAGNPGVPETTFLLAGPGEGKTATLEYVAMLCAPGGEFYGQTLAVRLDDFSPLLERVNFDLARLTARDYAFVVARAIIKALAEDVPATYFELLDAPEDRALLRLYIQSFGDGMSLLKLNRIITDPPLTGLDFERLSPREIIQMLADLVCKLGQAPGGTYRSLYVLVDRADESMAGREAVVALLRPLVAEGPLVQMKNLGFKFFLPKSDGHALLRETSLRRDRLRVEIIDWDEPSLERVIRQRLSHFSGGRFTELNQLCRPGAGTHIMERLIAASDRSPRRLLQLCYHLIEFHVEHSRDASPFTLIDSYDVLQTLINFSQAQAQASTPAVAALEDETQPEAIPANPRVSEGGLVYLDDEGQIFVQGRLLSPPLTAKEYRLFRALYRRAPNIVSMADIKKEVYKDDVEDVTVRKLINRLQQRLQAGLTGQPGEIINNVRGRGYWLNIN